MARRQTLEVIRDGLSRIGKSQADIARELNVDQSTVQGVMCGRLKGARGDAHKVAVALGLKRGVIVDDATSIADAIKAAIAA
ncbi:hypothetical protein [Sphingomonas oryzagri]